jgi:heparan-alpha-glucosaminide N-acetyltransferase
MGSEFNQPVPTGKRLASIDAYRGIVMFLMLAEVLELATLAAAYPESLWAGWLKFHTTHVEWVGCSLHDMIQPSFSFLVGVALPFSLRSRIQRGDSWCAMVVHAFFRAILLIGLGIVLRSLGKSSTNFTFDDTLTQIGLGYGVLFCLALTPTWSVLSSIVIILAGYWALFAYWPLPTSDFDLQSVGIPQDWPHQLTGFAAHWNKNTNPAWAFDVWFMNLFPRETPFEYHPGGYATISFIPTLATMLMGVIAGRMLQSNIFHLSRALWPSVMGIVILGAGIALNATGVCPNVKRIWTPAFALFSGGVCCLWLALLHMICDQWRLRLWAFPFMIIGANSILAYVMSWTLVDPLKDFLHRHFGHTPFEVGGATWEPVLIGGTVLLMMWLILYWLYRQRVFLRI